MESYPLVCVSVCVCLCDLNKFLLLSLKLTGWFNLSFIIRMYLKPNFQPWCNATVFFCFESLLWPCLTSISGHVLFVYWLCFGPTLKFLFWLTQLEVNSVDWKHYDQVFCCSFRKSREIVWFSFLSTLFSHLNRKRLNRTALHSFTYCLTHSRRIERCLSELRGGTEISWRH